MTSLWQQIGWVVRKDLKVELRSGEAVLITIPFGALALFAAALAVGANRPLLSTIGPGMLWLVVLLFGMLVTVRANAVDSPAVRALLSLNGLDPAAAFLGRASASAILLVLLTMTLAPVMIVLYAPDGLTGWAGLAALAVAGAVGIALIGSFAAVLVSGLRTRTVLAPLLVGPLAIPVLFATTRGTDSLISGGSIMSWLLLLVAMDLAIAIAGVLVAGPLDESAA